MNTGRLTTSLLWSISRTLPSSTTISWLRNKKTVFHSWNLTFHNLMILLKFRIWLNLLNSNNFTEFMDNTGTLSQSGNTLRNAITNAKDLDHHSSVFIRPLMNFKRLLQTSKVITLSKRAVKILALPLSTNWEHLCQLILRSCCWSKMRSFRIFLM